MPEFPFSRDEFAALTAKLDRLELTGKEYRLLSAIFAAAAAHRDPPAPEPPDALSIREQFEAAFQPGPLTGGHPGEFAIKIGGQ